jgi:tight adherence protein B
MLPESYDVYKLSHSELKKYFTVTLLLLFCLGYVFYKSMLVSFIMCMLSFGGLPYYRRVLADKRKNTLRLQFKDMLYSISSSVTAGRYLPEAIEESYHAVTLIHGENSILSREIKNMVRQMKEANSSDEVVLTDLSERSGVREITDFTDVCLTCRKTGGDLSKMIYRAVTILSQNIEIQKEKEVLMAQKKVESRILAAMPVIVTGFINMSSSDYLESMYTTFIGRCLMTIAFAGTVFSFLWSMKLTYTEGQVSV